MFQEEIQGYGIDLDGPIAADCNDIDMVEVPETTNPLDQVYYQEMIDTIDPCRPSNSSGIDIYLETVNFIITHCQQ